MKTALLGLLLFLGLPQPATQVIVTRFTPTQGYQRINALPGTFAYYLQHLPLKPAGTHTQTYTGAIAATDAYTAAVVNISVGNEDLQQCADAVMRLRGEYLYQQKRYNDIAFHFVNGFLCDYPHYANGYRYKNNKWVLSAAKDYSYNTFMRYMKLVFTYGCTLSLDKEMQKVGPAADVQVGDVFIKGGSPGHCFIVVDEAENSQHQKIFMLAQSFMPAQNIQVLQNGSPWFSLAQRAAIPYGELIDARYLKRFN